MARKRYKPEEIVAKLRQVDVLVSQGQAMADAIRQIGVSEVTYYRWGRFGACHLALAVKFDQLLLSLIARQAQKILSGDIPEQIQEPATWKRGRLLECVRLSALKEKPPDGQPKL
jgi:hypothetical protein